MDNKQIQQNAMIIAAVVRNEMEEFHGEHLTDEQMAELNPIIRNAIYSALYALDNPLVSHGFLKFHASTIPSYWEVPKLIGSLGDSE